MWQKLFYISANSSSSKLLQVFAEFRLDKIWKFEPTLKYFDFRRICVMEA